MPLLVPFGKSSVTSGIWQQEAVCSFIHSLFVFLLCTSDHEKDFRDQLIQLPPCHREDTPIEVRGLISGLPAHQPQLKTEFKSSFLLASPQSKPTCNTQGHLF
jgi:hypothetical protein